MLTCHVGLAGAAWRPITATTSARRRSMIALVKDCMTDRRHRSAAGLVLEMHRLHDQYKPTTRDMTTLTDGRSQWRSYTPSETACTPSETVCK